MRPAKTQISLDICPVWSESSLCDQWEAKDPSFLHADSEDSDQIGRMPWLIRVFAGRTLILLVLSCRGSNDYCEWVVKTNLIIGFNRLLILIKIFLFYTSIQSLYDNSVLLPFRTLGTTRLYQVHLSPLLKHHEAPKENHFSSRWPALSTFHCASTLGISFFGCLKAQVLITSFRPCFALFELSLS